MAVLQDSFEHKRELEEVTEFKKKAMKAFTSSEYRCTCGNIDYEILHGKSWSSIPDGEVQVICNRCGRKNSFDLKRLSKFVEDVTGDVLQR